VQMLAIEKVLNSVNCDLRQALNVMQMWRRTSNTLEIGDDTQAFNKRLESAQKNIDQGPFDVLPKFFQRGLPSASKFDMYYVDASLIPLMIQDNYLTARVDSIEQVSRAADSISDAALLEPLIHMHQMWELSNAHAL